MMTASSTTCSRGDVVMVGVRFSDGSGVKRRPAVVVSVDAVHAERADALIVPLATNLSARRLGDHPLAHWESAGLPRPSMAKGVVETVERTTFGATVGRLDEEDLAAVEVCLRQVLGL